MLIETHAHLDYPDFDHDRDAVVQRALDAGVETIITIGTDLEDSRKAIALAEKYPNVYATVGIHPSNAMEAPEDADIQLKELARHPRVVAIGECGLDYHRLPSSEKPPFADLSKSGFGQDTSEIETQLADDEVKNKQAILFRQQLDLAVELGLNMVVHQRESWDDALAILADYHGKLKTVFHCFGENAERANLLIQHGHFVSFTGIVTFKNAKQVQETAKKIPAGSFFLETDCPYLAPAPHRGGRCEPSYVPFIAEKIAGLRGISVEEIARETTDSAKAFFRL